MFVSSIKLAIFKDPPQCIMELYTESNEVAKNFRKNIRQYNGALSLASKQITGKMYQFPESSYGPPIFKMSGQMYHLMGPVLPELGEQPKFSQLYVYDRDHEVGNRMQTQKGQLSQNLMSKLQESLRKSNFYVQQFEHAADVMQANPTQELKLCFKSKGNMNVKKKHNLPEVTDVGILAPGDMAENRAIVLYCRQSQHPKQNATTRINQLHEMYDPTAYVLLFPYGDSGYSIPAPLKFDGDTEGNKPISLLEFYKFHLMIRGISFNTIHRAGRLFQEYLCDMYSKIEGARPVSYTHLTLPTNREV